MKQTLTIAVATVIATIAASTAVLAMTASATTTPNQTHLLQQIDAKLTRVETETNKIPRIEAETNKLGPIEVELKKIGEEALYQNERELSLRGQHNELRIYLYRILEEVLQLRNP